MTRQRAARGGGPREVRFAVIGQGHFAQTTILPAFANARRAELAAIFSDDETKLAALRRKYRVEHALPYDQLDEFLRSGAVEAVYIAVPNDLHATKPGDARFREIDEQVAALLRFPGDRLAQITCSFGAADVASCTVLGTKGRLRLDPAFDLSDLSTCIREGRDPEPSGREGLADLRVIEAIEAAARGGARVAVERVFPQARPSMGQARRAGSSRKGDGVHVEPPSA